MEFIKTAVKGATVHVIDDNVPLARAFGKALSLAGYRVAISHDAVSALEEVQRLLPEAIVLDVEMPFVNGVGFLYRIRAMKPLHDTPVIVVTGQALNGETQAEIRNLGAQLLKKPLAIGDLVTAVRASLDARAGRGPGDD